MTKPAPFGGVFAGKKVLVTGHTGFKGTWLSAWLRKLGASVVGVSKGIPTTPAMFEVLRHDAIEGHHVADLRDLDAIRSILRAERPDFVFHLAAQAIVSVSYSDPVETMTTNVLGTVNVLEALRDVDYPCVAVLITSDKAYDNVEWVWGYRETDALGGKDVYSGSKGAAELAIKSYVASFFAAGKHPVRIAIGRAGNVIGGGDWARDRIVVDCMRAWSEGRYVEIRSPEATRPWQHVLEPLSGYLTLGAALSANGRLHGEAFNFGPRAEQNRTVVDLIRDLSARWSFERPDDCFRVTGNIPFHEASLLKLNCDKALADLKWTPTLDYAETIDFVSEWYYAYYRERRDMRAVTEAQIDSYESLGRSRDRTWTR